MLFIGICFALVWAKMIFCKYFIDLENSIFLNIFTAIAEKQKQKK